ncbi:MAG: DUF3874 domain-containing protein [Tannerellaceae bacterium]|nr:DUF3874 domain-containing protein [Tannerellaceae bacterium]
MRKGEHYWLNTEEEQRLSQSNNQFLQIPLEIQYTLAYFRKPQPDEEATGYKAAELLNIVARKSKQNFSKTTTRQYAEWLLAQGFERQHTRYGNVFKAVSIKSAENNV